jgi:hypothetical protein
MRAARVGANKGSPVYRDLETITAASYIDLINPTFATRP